MNRSRTVRWILVLWILAFPAIVAWSYLTSVERYAESSVIFVGGLLFVPWLVGTAVLALLSRRWGTTA